VSPESRSPSPLDDALAVVERFVAEVTGRTPTSDEIAAALRRYFVLKEITDHIEMDREQADSG
jgi:hypothetical protein